MPNTAHPLENSIRRRLHFALKNKHLSQKVLAAEMGLTPKVLNHWFSGSRHIPAYVLPQLCGRLDDHKALDDLETAAGRVAVAVPHASELAHLQDIMVVQRLIKEVGEALESLARTLADGKVEEHELPETVRELDEVIQECIRLKHWLKKRCEEDKANPV
jgi:transcriptional regulator with XRE-family HTH domain